MLEVVVSFVQESTEWGMRKGGSMATTLQCSRFQCKFLATLGITNISMSFLIHPFFSTTRPPPPIYPQEPGHPRVPWRCLTRAVFSGTSEELSGPHSKLSGSLFYSLRALGADTYTLVIFCVLVCLMFISSIRLSALWTCGILLVIVAPLSSTGFGT